MRDTATDSVRPRRRTGPAQLGWICGAFVALQILVVALLPPHLRGITAGLLTMVTIVAVIAAAMEISFQRAGARASRPAAGTAGTTALPRRPRERVSPLIQQAYRLARSSAPASHIADSCEIPEAFAALIIDDVRRAGSRRKRAARDAPGPRHGGRSPGNPPAD